MLNAVSPLDVHITYNHIGKFKTKNGKKYTNTNQKKAKGLSAPQGVQALGSVPRKGRGDGERQKSQKD